MVNWKPVVQGGTPSKWSVTPALPDGVALNEKTGNILGRLVGAAANVEYAISAENSSGATTAKLGIPDNL